MSALAGFSAGLAASNAQTLAEYKDKPMRDLRVRQAQAQVQLAEAQVASVPAMQSQAEMMNEKLSLELRAMQGQVIKQESFDTFRRYTADGDVRHLNSFLTRVKSNPMGSSVFGPVVRFDAIDKSADGAKMLASVGITDYDGVVKDPSLKQNFVVATMADGEQKLVSMAQLYAGTGYTQMLDNESLEMQLKKASLLKALQTGNSVENVTARERVAREWAAAEGISVWEAYQKLERQSTGGSVVERIADEIQLANPEMSRMDALTQSLNMNKSTEKERLASNTAAVNGTNSLDEQLDIRRQDLSTTAMRDIEAAGKVRQELDSLAGGDFFKTDLSDPALRRKVGPQVMALQKLSGTEFSESEKKLARDVRQLITLGGTASSGITDAETGPIDSLLRSVKKYFVNETGGTVATSSYETFRNIVRNSLYGASLTEGETKAFTKAVGSLSQQTKPALAGLRTQLVSLKDQLGAMSVASDPYVSHYYLGMDSDRLEDVLDAIDQRIGLIDDAGSTVPATKVVVPQSDSQPRKSLDEIFGR